MGLGYSESRRGSTCCAPLMGTQPSSDGARSPDGVPLEARHSQGTLLRQDGVRPEAHHERMHGGDLRRDSQPRRGYHRSQVTGYRSQVTGHRSQVSGYRSQPSVYRSQVSGHRSQVIGHRSQVTGHRSQGTGLQIPNQDVVQSPDGVHFTSQDEVQCPDEPRRDSEPRRGSKARFRAKTGFHAEGHATELRRGSSCSALRHQDVGASQRQWKSAGGEGYR